MAAPADSSSSSSSSSSPADAADVVVAPAAPPAIRADDDFDAAEGKSSCSRSTSKLDVDDGWNLCVCVFVCMEEGGRSGVVSIKFCFT